MTVGLAEGILTSAILSAVPLTYAALGELASEKAGIVNLGVDTGPHMISLTDDDKRLVVSDYFLNEDWFGKVHAEGDHRVHVLHVTRDELVEDSRFNLDFNTAFETGPARPHGIAIK